LVKIYYNLIDKSIDFKLFKTYFPLRFRVKKTFLCIFALSRKKKHFFASLRFRVKKKYFFASLRFRVKKKHFFA